MSEPSTADMTFVDLFNFLQSYGSCKNDIISWLQEPWQGKDKQESLLRLFAYLGLISKLRNYTMCKGNFNMATIEPIQTTKDVFYDDSNNAIKLKDSGDKSDLHGQICNENQKIILATTSKNLNVEHVGDLELRDILSISYDKYKGWELHLCVCVRDSKRTKEMVLRAHEGNEDLKIWLEKKTTIIIDWNDLNEAFHEFKLIYGNTNIEYILKINKKPLLLKLHQRLSVMKTIRMKGQGHKKILWGHIQRSGKSYIMAGAIIEDSKNKDRCNYLVITTAKNETVTQYLEVFNCSQLQDFNIVNLDGKNKNPVLTEKNIIICSKQFLQYKIEKGHDQQRDTLEKTTSIPWLKKMNFEMRFIDEAHNGGTTELAKDTLKYYGNNSFTIQITATYSKPINDYNIPKENWILWDLEDIKLCKNIEKESNILKLTEKHGHEMENIIHNYSQQNILDEYLKYPELVILTNKINSDVLDEIIENTNDNHYGWSPDACFLPKQCVETTASGIKKIIKIDEFQNESEALKIWYCTFGKTDKRGIPDKNYPDDQVFMKRIEKICKNPEINSRFIGDTEDPMIIMAFLPQNDIDIISNATMKLLKKYNVIPDYDIVSINSNVTNNPKKTIEDARKTAKNSGKKGVLVLSGKQCSLGVTIKKCDIVLLMNNNMGFDMIYQMMFRSMSEEEGKKCGFVVDFNIHRAIDTSIVEYSSLIKPNDHPRDAIKYVLQERLINLNGDDWMPSFGNVENKLTVLSDNIYKIFSSRLNGAIDNIMRRFNLKPEFFSKESFEVFNSIFKDVKFSGKKKKESLEKLKKEMIEKNIKKGIEKTKVENSNGDDCDSDSDSIDSSGNNSINDSSISSSDTDNDNSLNYIKINPFDILKPISMMCSLLTIHENDKTTLEEMYNVLAFNPEKKSVLLNQIRMIWDEKIQNHQIESLITIFKAYLENDRETTQLIRYIKELLHNNINNSNELAKIVDKYLIPQEKEKMDYAEYSTPYITRKNMLDTMPFDFWQTPKKVFEPSSGKGGFLLDIIDRFMIGLKNKIPDEKERYKIIVEECLYWSDINETNIFICKLLVDPHNLYKLKYNQGSTLDLNIKSKWGLDGFDAVIGNPPYHKGKNSNFYVKFMDLAESVLKMGGYILYVIPNRFLIPGHKANHCINKFNVELIMHTVNDFDVSTDIGYYLGVKSENIDNTSVKCIFKDNVEYYINLNDPTPTANNSIEFKALSDNILRFNKHGKIKFIKSDKNNIDKKNHIFIPRHWARYATSKSKGGRHVFKIVNEFGDDGRFVEINENTKENIIWYLTRSKIIRFITNNYASTVFIPPFIWKSIPNIDFTIKYDNNQLYDLFGLTPEEKELIEKVVD
uniref:Uncharacterized protein n=1 Tax=viral metagenome TaxID=1070528 RepID=A0A6C0HAD5_9ZZZZ